MLRKTCGDLTLCVTPRETSTELQRANVIQCARVYCIWKTEVCIVYQNYPLWVFTLSNENAFNSRCLFVLTCREQKLSKHPQCNYFKLSFCDWYHIAPEKMSDSRWVFIALHILLSSLLHYNNERKKQKNRYVRLSAMLDIPFTIVLHKLLFPFIFCVSHS